MLVQHVMTPTVVAVSPDQTIGDAIKKMIDYRISGLPVVGADGTLLGILSESDFLRRAELGTGRKHSRWLAFFMPGKIAGEYVHEHGRRVKEIMTPNPITVDEYAPLEDAAELMEKHYIKRLPVTRKGRMIGMLTRSDMMRVIAERGRALPPLKDSDQTIRQQMLEQITRQPWLSGSPIDVTVSNGKVTLLGTVHDSQQARALEVLASNVKGVSSVTNGIRILQPEFAED